MAPPPDCADMEGIDGDMMTSSQLLPGSEPLKSFGRLSFLEAVVGVTGFFHLLAILFGFSKVGWNGREIDKLLKWWKVVGGGYIGSFRVHQKGPHSLQVGCRPCVGRPRRLFKNMESCVCETESSSIRPNFGLG